MTADSDIIISTRPLCYPRPIIKCPNCQQDTILCWGDKRRPYLRHKKKSCSQVKKSDTENESELHVAAKTMLCDFLNAGNSISINIICDICKTKISELTTPDSKWKTEAVMRNDFGRAIFDIAAYDQYNNLIFGLEIFNTHRANINCVRNTVPWVDLDAVDIIDKLDSDDKGNIYFTDFRQDRICDKEQCYEKRRLNITCHIYSHHVYPNLGEFIDNYDISHIGLPNSDIARKMGYWQLKARYSHIVQRYLDEAIKGGYIEDWECWTLYGYEEIDIINSFNSDTQCTFTSYNNMWANFLQRCLCMKCDKYYDNIRYQKPYCIECHKLIQENSIDDDERLNKRLTKDKFDILKIISNRQKDLRNALNFLDKINNVKKYEEISCIECKELFKVDVWWYGKYKQICCDCVLRIMQLKYNPINNSINPQLIIQ